ncbi:MAG TPA: hypothetical protein VFT53_05685 [Candidatus Saccharimonadales bacterium]|nr:hypothetical protein [Candidatus Saccharimonadales bacterium]
MTQLLFTQLNIAFKVLSGNITGNGILQELSGFINTDLAEFKVDEDGVDIWFVTTEGSEQAIQACEEVKQSLEKSVDARLSYIVTSIDL